MALTRVRRTKRQRRSADSTFPARSAFRAAGAASAAMCSCTAGWFTSERSSARWAFVGAVRARSPTEPSCSPAARATASAPLGRLHQLCIELRSGPGLRFGIVAHDDAPLALQAGGSGGPGTAAPIVEPWRSGTISASLLGETGAPSLGQTDTPAPHIACDVGQHFLPLVVRQIGERAEPEGLSRALRTPSPLGWEHG